VACSPPPPSAVLALCRVLCIWCSAGQRQESCARVPAAVREPLLLLGLLLACCWPAAASAQFPGSHPDVRLVNRVIRQALLASAKARRPFRGFSAFSPVADPSLLLLYDGVSLSRSACAPCCLTGQCALLGRCWATAARDGSMRANGPAPGPQGRPLTRGSRILPFCGSPVTSYIPGSDPTRSLAPSSSIPER
jgi:hypothetical protein